jgi:hypothetical protein
MSKNKQYRKRYTKMYDAIWTAIHKDDRVVFATTLSYEELVDVVTVRLAQYLAEAATDTMPLRDAVDLILCELMWASGEGG